MYRPLRTDDEYYDKFIFKNPITDQEIYTHDKIWDSHYTQMQSLMWVTGRKWCDYVVCSLEDDDDHQWYMERVKFNKKFWKKTMKRIIKNLIPYRKEIENTIILPDGFDKNNLWII